MRSQLVLVVISLSVLSGCADGGARVDTSEQPSGSLRGVVWLSPTCPVEQEGQPCAPERAGGASVTLTAAGVDGQDTGRVVGKATSDDEGRFTIAVDPGSYLLTADAGMLCKPIPVDVPTGGDTTVDLTCDTGIR